MERKACHRVASLFCRNGIPSHMFMCFIFLITVLPAESSVGDVGICWTRNEVPLRKTDAQLASEDLYPLSEAARSARLAAPDVKLCVFTNLSPKRLHVVMGEALGADDAAGLFDLVLPTGDIMADENVEVPTELRTNLDRVGRVLTTLRAAKELDSAFRKRFVRLQTAVVLIGQLSSRLGRMLNMMRAPYETTLFLDDDVFLCAPPRPSPPLREWLGALFAQQHSVDVRISSYDLSRGWLMQGVVRSPVQAECLRNRCAQVCDGEHAWATPACFSCKLGCPDDAQSPNRSQLRYPGHASFSAQGGAIAVRGGQARAVGVGGGARDEREGRELQYASCAGVKSFFLDWMYMLLSKSKVLEAGVWDVMHANASELVTIHANGGGGGGGAEVVDDKDSVDDGFATSRFKLDNLSALLSFAAAGRHDFGQDQMPLASLLGIARATETCIRMNAFKISAIALCRHPYTLRLDWSFGELMPNFNLRPSLSRNKHKLASDGLAPYFLKSMEPATPIWGPLFVVHDDMLITSAHDAEVTLSAHRRQMRAHGERICSCANANVSTSPWRLVQKIELKRTPKVKLQTMEVPATCADYTAVMNVFPLDGGKNVQEWTEFVHMINEKEVAESALKTGRSIPNILESLKIVKKIKAQLLSESKSSKKKGSSSSSSGSGSSSSKHHGGDGGGSGGGGGGGHGDSSGGDGGSKTAGGGSGGVGSDAESSDSKASSGSSSSTSGRTDLSQVQAHILV